MGVAGGEGLPGERHPVGAGALAGGAEGDSLDILPTERCDDAAAFGFADCRMLLGDVDEGAVEECDCRHAAIHGHFGVVAGFFEAGDRFAEAHCRVGAFEAHHGPAEEGLTDLLKDAVADIGIFEFDCCDDRFSNVFVDLGEERFARAGEAEEVARAARTTAFEIEGGEALIDEGLHMLASSADGEEGFGGEGFGGCLTMPLQNGHQHPASRVEQIEARAACHDGMVPLTPVYSL